MFKAILWDVDGTLAETERDGHRVAFNLAFEAFGLPWRWDERHYGDLLNITGGRERLLYDMAQRGDVPAVPGEGERLARAIHERENTVYGQLMHQRAIPFRAGVPELLEQCRTEDVRVAITTTTSRSNVDALLRSHFGAPWQERFAGVVCGEDVRSKKPDPEAYLKTLAILALRPQDTLAIEDSPGGVAAARAADIPVVVTRSHYFCAAPIDGAIALGPGLHQRRGWRPALPGGLDVGPVGLNDLRGWFAEAQSVPQFP